MDARGAKILVPGGSSDPSGKLDGLCARFQLVKVVRPFLHHTAPFGQVSGAVVGPPVGIAYRMGELVLDVIGPEPQYFIEDGSGHCPKAVFRIA